LSCLSACRWQFHGLLARAGLSRRRSLAATQCPLAPAADDRRTAPSSHILGDLGQRDEPLPPYQIVISSSQALQRTVINAPNAVLITAVTQYINRSPSGHSALVQRELLQAVFDIPGLQSTTMHYSPFQVVTTSTPIKDPQQTPRIDAKPVADPSIVVVNPQSAFTHEVLFWPTGAPDWYEWSKFVENGRNNGSYKQITITINLLPAIYTKHGMLSSWGQKTLPTSCVVKLSEPDFISLSNNGWLAPVCTWES
jgi:hypothetical protein